MPAVILASSVLCAGGRGTEQVWATVRAGVACIGNSHVVDRNFDPISMGLIPEDALEPLTLALEHEPLPSQVRRMLRLAGPTLAAVAQTAGPTPLTLYLGLPRAAASENPWVGTFLGHLARAAAVPINSAASRVMPMGRAAVFYALEAALATIAVDPAAIVVVGGVDTYLDLRRIAELDAEGRILGPRVMDGLIPGEGAAFLVLKDSRAATGDGANAMIQSAATVSDPGHRYGDAPALGEGLAQSIDLLRGRLDSPAAPVTSIFAGFNGENFEAKLWGVARIRHSDFFAADADMLHPADCIGDSGAAAGAILTAIAAFALKQGDRGGPVLAWAASDHEQRGCALLSGNGT